VGMWNLRSHGVLRYLWGFRRKLRMGSSSWFLNCFMLGEFCEVVSRK
jgi:hypothetical protein